MIRVTSQTIHVCKHVQVCTMYIHSINIYHNARTTLQQPQRPQNKQVLQSTLVILHNSLNTNDLNDINITRKKSACSAVKSGNISMSTPLTHAHIGHYNSSTCVSIFCTEQCQHKQIVVMCIYLHTYKGSL